MKNRNIQNLIIFTIITLASGWFGVLLDSVLTEQPDGNSLGMGLWLILPFLTAIILRIIYKDWNDIGIKLYLKRNLKWYLLSLIIYPFVTVISVGLALVFGNVKMSAFDIQAFLALAGSSVVGGFLKNIFEEFSWRGYLTPKLITLNMKDWMIYFSSGLIWGLWHAAYYLVFLPNDYFKTMSRINFFLFACFIMVCWSVMYVELYRLTKTVWPCVLLHAVEDAFPNVLVITGGYISFTGNGDFWFNPITGIAAILLFLCIGLILRSIRKGTTFPNKIKLPIE